MRDKTTEFEQHQFLAKLIDGSQKRDKANLNRIKQTLELCKTEEKLPELALISYCYLGNLEKVKELTSKVKKITSSGIRSYLFPTLESGNNKILEFLLANSDPLSNSTFRSVVTKACSLGHNKQLRTLLRNTTTHSIDEATFRFTGINALLANKLDIFSTICQHAKTEWLEDWKLHLTTEMKQAGKWNKELYYKGLQILNSEQVKRNVMNKLSNTNEISIQ